MEQKYLKHISLFGTLVFFISIAKLSYAETSIKVGEDYYGNDMDAAVQEAQQNQRKVDYNNKYWYNRTTSKSFSLPHLDTNELEQAQLKGALEPTAAGQSQAQDNSNNEFLINPLELERNENDSNEVVIKENQTLVNSPSPLVIPNIEYEFTRGDKVQTYNIISSGTITSTPRP